MATQRVENPHLLSTIMCGDRRAADRGPGIGFCALHA
jgi:hypothetical protein